MTHIMLDLETMGTRPDAAIVQIGAVAFRPFSGEQYDNFFCNVDLDTCMQIGLTTSAATILWWLEGGSRGDIIDPVPDGIIVALMNYSSWLNRFKLPIFTWAYSPQFDIQIMRSAYAAAKLICPLGYRYDLDLRTLLHVTGEQEAIKREVRADAHDALADAKFQARICSQVVQKLGFAIME